MQIQGKGNAFAVAFSNWAVRTLWNQVSPIPLGKLQWKFYLCVESVSHRCVVNGLALIPV